MLFASVFLRRDIASMGESIGNSVHLSEKNNYATLLTEIVDTMMDIFWKSNDETNMFLGHDVAKIYIWVLAH